jgi:hypothetical protein
MVEADKPRSEKRSKAPDDTTTRTARNATAQRYDGCLFVNIEGALSSCDIEGYMICPLFHGSQISDTAEKESTSCDARRLMWRG